MNHARIHELLALRLYGELDPAEERELHEHLPGCADCRTVADELEATLGPHVRGLEPGEATALPDDWTVRIERIPAEHPGPPRLARLLPFAAGLAAGVLFTVLLRAPGAAPPRRATSVADRMGYVESASLPPPAPIRGRLSTLDDARR